ncbi:two-component system connector SafA [Escherichia coli]|uniref:two-component system connector SafA n=1 Tax=Escherichia coli TaxID=562 RepID=UPI0039898B22
MHATTVKNKITQRDNYKEIMSVIVVVLLLTLTLIAIFSAIDQLGISEMGRGNDSNLLIVFYVQIMPDDFVMQLHRF